jgi:sulfoxide reductase catalytic subunit YedY
MTHVHVPRPWNLPESEAVPESVYLDRRAFLRKMGLGTAGVAAALAAGGVAGCDAADGRDGAAGQEGPLDQVPDTPTAGLYPEARKDPRFAPGDRHGHVTPEDVSAAYNNFYEFGTDKRAVWKRVGNFVARPWEIEVGGLVEEPATFDLVELERAFELEERIYRHRCVEAWSVVVPWIGFPLRSLVERVRPLSDARYLRFVGFDRPRQAPGQQEQTWYPWPYYEALEMEEAVNELAFLVTGMYGHPLQKQNGAPVRLHVPWKYGFKSIKSVVRIEFTRERPPVFWNDVASDEYSWHANVDPERPHPRWSQARETVVETGEEVPTLPYNGYGEWVAGLYG